MRALLAASLFALALFFQFSFAQASDVKEWTMLIYLNGNNSLDDFGPMNLNQAETVGSSNDVNVVAQWASLKNKDTRRLMVVKDKDTRKVTSPILENMGKVDMGDYKTLVEFIKWGAKNFPAKHYMVDIWNHGSGWHEKNAFRGGFGTLDISIDDTTGHSISTKQLGQAFREASAAIGQKIDLYGSDACLMAMAEVATEVSDSVNVFLGSQDLEPGAGWPYGDFLTLWTAKPTATPAEVSQMLVTSYVDSYKGGSNGRDNVTLSSFNLSYLDGLNKAVKDFGVALQKVDKGERKKVVAAIQASQSYFYDDYIDLGDLMANLKKGAITTLDTSMMTAVADASKNFVITSGQNGFPKATGISIWAPADMKTYSKFAPLYGELEFQARTGWQDTLKTLLQ